MNMELFTLINNLAGKNKILDQIMFCFSKYVPYIFMLIIAAVFVSGIVKRNIDFRKASVSTFIITVINLALSFIIGSIYYEDRPFVNNKVNLMYPHDKDASFPSDHSIGTMSIALGLGKYKKTLSRILIVLSIMVGISRIYVGHHYPVDVVAAYVIAYLTNYVYNKRLRNKIENLYESIEKGILTKLGFEVGI